MSAPRSAKNPFPGLRPFETEEYTLFFGREGQSDELLARLERSRFLAVVGTSGSGKSSLIRAGLMPALHGGMMKGAGAGWRIAVMRPGGDPIGNLAAELVKKGVLSEAGAGLPDDEAEAVIEATLRSGSLGIVNVARQARLSDHEKLLVIVDQFEELFRFRAAEERSTADEASAFVKLLLEASQQRALAIYIVLTMRSDFLGDCAHFQGLPEAINEGQYLIPRMTRDERRFAVTGPVGVTRGKISEPLVNRLLNEVGDNPDQLPILQHALMRTWDYWQTRRRNGEPIGIEHYEAIGTMADALSRHADEAFHELANDRSRHIAEVLFKTLCERGADNREIRRPTRLDTICKIADASIEEVIAVIDVFRKSGRSFLMPPIDTKLHGASVIDISHESLIRNWQRLKKWVNDEVQSVRIYRRVAEAAVLHREGTEGLLQDPALQFALDWREKSHPTAAWGQRYHPEFEAVIAYLDKSSAARDAKIAAEEIKRNEDIARDKRELEQTKEFAAQQTRSARRMRWLIIALCLILLVAVGTAAYALNLRAIALSSQAAAVRSAEDANKAKLESIRQKEIAEEKERMALAAEKAMGIERQKAQDAAVAADQQRAIAVQNLQAARLATQRAKDASIAAQKYADERKGAIKRGELMRDGLEASQRDDYAMARDAFHKLRDKLKPLQPDEAQGQSFTAQESRQLVYDYGWAFSRLANAHHKLGAYKEAIENYENGRTVLERVLQNQPEPILFETYHGLAHAYHDDAKHSPGRGTSTDRRTSTELALTPELSKAEDYYKRVVDYYEHSKLEKPVDAATSLKHLARLYIDLGKFAEAEQRLKDVVQVYKDTSDANTGLDGTKTALRDLAEFYRSRAMFQEAAQTYNELIDVQEAQSVSVYDTRGMRELADNYSELGQVYKVLKQESRSDASFKLVETLQDAHLKVRHMSAPGSETDAELIELAKILDQIADLYVKLERFKEAEETYDTALAFREDIKSDNSSRGTSYLKLANLYKEKLNNYPKAEIYYKQLIEVRKNAKGPLGPNQPLSQYVEGLRQLANIYAQHMNKPAEAEPLFETALTSLATVSRPVLMAWNEEEKIYTALFSLYQQNPAKTEATSVRRLGTMARRARLFSISERRTEAYARLISSLVKTTREIGQLYLKRSDNANAEAAYRTMSDVTSLASNLQKPAQVDDYIGSLENYKALIKDSKPADLPKIDKLIQTARTKKQELEADSEPAESTPADPPPMPKQLDYDLLGP